jgi:hypothetical protein
MSGKVCEPLIYVEVDGVGQNVPVSRLTEVIEWQFGPDYVVCAPTYYLDGDMTKHVKRSAHVYSFRGLPLGAGQGQIGG